MPKAAEPRIFVSLAGPSLKAIEAQALTINGPTVGFEFRLDFLLDLAGLEGQVRQLLARLHFPQTIATCRRAQAGGHFRGPVTEQVAALAAAVRAGCQWVDLEIETVARTGSSVLQRFRPAKVIVSYHNDQQTPALSKIYSRLARFPARVIKIATHARNLRDNLRIFRLLHSHRRRGHKLVALATSVQGIPSRLLALQRGCPFTYASAGYQVGVAPGQVPWDVMRSMYRIERLDHRTQYYAIVGSHVSRSLSPAMHNMAFQAKRVNAVYLPCETNRLADFMTFARELGFAGFSVTMPFKQAVLRELDWVDPIAAHIGACNTVAVQHGKWMGWNTDAAAVVEVLTKRLRLAGSRLLVLGAGGAARAAAYALRAEGAVVFIAARRDAAARRLARGISAQVVPWGSTNGLDVDAVINATPVGMPPHIDALPIDLARLRVRVVFEMVYYPPETRLLAEARRRGLTTISGLEMLVAQGARQFEIWTGQTAPRALMEQAVRQALDHAMA